MGKKSARRFAGKNSQDFQGKSITFAESSAHKWGQGLYAGSACGLGGIIPGNLDYELQEQP
jgi:hypothetical protein